MASSKNSFSKDCCIVWLVLSGWFSRKIRSLYTKYSPLSFSLKCELLFKAEISFHKMKFSRGLRGAYESWEIITNHFSLAAGWCACRSTLSKPFFETVFGCRFEKFGRMMVDLRTDTDLSCETKRLKSLLIGSFYHL